MRLSSLAVKTYKLHSFVNVVINNKKKHTDILGRILGVCRHTWENTWGMPTYLGEYLGYADILGRILGVYRHTWENTWGMPTYLEEYLGYADIPGRLLVVYQLLETTLLQLHFVYPVNVLLVETAFS